MLDWLYTLIATVLKLWHSLFSTFLDPAGGTAWVLSIVLFVVTMRLLLLPLFLRQVRTIRLMVKLQPEIKRITTEHKDDSAALGTALTALQKEHGLNPLANLLPVFVQIPIFLALFHVLRRLAPGADGLYGWSDALTDQAASASVFGAPFAASLRMSGEKEAAVLALSGGAGTIQVVAFSLLVLMCVASFFTQYVTNRRSPAVGAGRTVQRVLLFGLPTLLLLTGFLFPIGVQVYWVANTVWGFFQQLYVLRKYPPAPPVENALTA